MRKENGPGSRCVKYPAKVRRAWGSFDRGDRALRRKRPGSWVKAAKIKVIGLLSKGKARVRGEIKATAKVRDLRSKPDRGIKPLKVKTAQVMSAIPWIELKQHLEEKEGTDRESTGRSQ